MSFMTDTTTIKCPHCGAEYHPAEIFIGEHLIGKPKDIVRDEMNHIVFIGGRNMDLNESYNCDFCGKDFMVTATMKFTTSYTISNDYVTKINRKNLFLEET